MKTDKKHKILIGSIFTVLILLSMPFVSANDLQERQTDILTITSAVESEDDDPVGGMGAVTFHAFYDKDRDRNQDPGEDDASGASVHIYFRKSLGDAWQKLVLRYTDSNGELTAHLLCGYLYSVQIFSGYWWYFRMNLGVSVIGIKIECPLIAPWWDYSTENDISMV